MNSNLPKYILECEQNLDGTFSPIVYTNIGDALQTLAEYWDNQDFPYQSLPCYLTFLNNGFALMVDTASCIKLWGRDYILAGLSEGFFLPYPS